MMRAAEQDRPDVAEKRTRWQTWQVGIDPSRLLFIDETWATTNMTRLRGRAAAGQRVIGVVPHGHWKTTTLIAAMGLAGVQCSMVIDGAINRPGFEAFIQQVLLPTLKPGQIVVMDNLSSHKGPRVAELIHQASAELLYLPPYSPDLSPIEPAFSKIKQLLRSAAHRTADALWGSMQSILDRVNASDANGYFRHCGYAIY
jgi:transposase